MFTKIKTWIKAEWDKTRKWFKLLFFVPVAMAAGIAGQQPEKPVTIDKTTIQEKFQDATEIKAKYVNEGSSFREAVKPDWKEKTEVRIGEETATEFKPTFELRKWDETRIKLTPKLETVASKDKSVDFVGENIKFNNGSKEEVSFESLPDSTTTPEGGYEINWTLNEKPKTNVVEFDIETEGLNFFYQSPLTELPYKPGVVRCTETQGFDKNGNVLDERPENVVGSYVIYASEQKTNWVGGKLYRTGQVGIIYRPTIIDSVGNWTWGILNIDKDKGIFNVEIPQSFLDTATYPIRHAAGLTFGYTTAGSSSYGYLGMLYGNTKNVSGAGTVTSMSFNIKSGAGVGVSGAVAIYRASTKALIDHVNSSDPSNGWNNTLASQHSGSLLDATEYGLTWWENNSNLKWAYDTSQSGIHRSSGQYIDYSANNWPNPTTGTFITVDASEYSIYATYTASGGSTPAPRPRRQIIDYEPTSPSPLAILPEKVKIKIPDIIYI